MLLGKMCLAEVVRNNVICKFPALFWFKIFFIKIKLSLRWLFEFIMKVSHKHKIEQENYIASRKKLYVRHLLKNIKAPYHTWGEIFIQLAVCRIIYLLK